MRVGPERHRHAGRGEGAGRADAVAEVAFGGRAHRHGRTGRGERGDVGVVDMGGVHRREPRRERSRILEHPGRCSTVTREARLVLGGLLRHVGMEHRPGVGGPARHRPDRVRVDGAHGMDGGTDPPGVGGAERGDTLDPCSDGADR